MRSANGLALLDREGERAPAVDDAAVELLDVLLGVVLVERARVRVAEFGKPVGGGLDCELVVAVQLLRLVAVGAVVLVECTIDVVEQVSVLFLEERELAFDDLPKALTTEHAS